MNVVRNFNKAIQYIEENLEKEIGVTQIAKVAGYAPYHFMRMFSAFTGVGVMEYVRRRRVTKAAEEIQQSDQKIIDIALKYGYESPTAFNRAFQAIHGVSPSRARKEATKLTSYLPLSFSLTIEGVEKMEYRIETIESFRAVGYKRSFNFKNGENFEKIPLFWKEIFKHGECHNITALQNGKPQGLLGIVGNLREDDLDYYIAVSTNKKVPDGMEELTIATQSYAIFHCTMDKIQETTKRILSEWLPNSEYTHVDNAPELEIYPDEIHCKICIPVKK